MSEMPQLETDDDNTRRFGGLQRLYGVAGAQRIRHAHVVVVGIGGVGSWVAEALARSGVARLTLIDMDHISESNINRQILALSNTTGQSKVLAMQERIALIHPQCQVDAVDDCPMYGQVRRVRITLAPLREGGAPIAKEGDK